MNSVPIYGSGSHLEITNLPSSSLPTASYISTVASPSNPPFLSSSANLAWESSFTSPLHDMPRSVPQDGSAAPPRRRAAIACTRCRKRKIACNSGDPRLGPQCKSCQVANISPELCQFRRVGTDAPQEIPYSAFRLNAPHLRNHSHSHYYHSSPLQYRSQIHPRVSRMTTEGYHESGLGGTLSNHQASSLSSFGHIMPSGYQNQTFISSSITSPNLPGMSTGISFGLSEPAGDVTGIITTPYSTAQSPSVHASADHPRPVAHLPAHMSPEGWTETSSAASVTYQSAYSTSPTQPSIQSQTPSYSNEFSNKHHKPDETSTSSSHSSQQVVEARQSIARVLSAEVYPKPRCKIIPPSGQIACDPAILPSSDGSLSTPTSGSNHLSFASSLTAPVASSRPVSICTSASTDSLLVCKDVDINPLGYVTSGLSNLSVPQDDSSPASETGSGGYGPVRTPVRALSHSDDKWVNLQANESEISHHEDYQERRIPSFPIKIAPSAISREGEGGLGAHQNSLGELTGYGHQSSPSVPGPDQRYGYGYYPLPRYSLMGDSDFSAHPCLASGSRVDMPGEGVHPFGYGAYGSHLHNFK